MELRLKIQRWIVGSNSQNWVGGNYPAKLKYKEQKVSLSKKEPHEFFLFHNIFSQISSKYKIQKTWNTQKKFEKKKKPLNSHLLLLMQVCYVSVWAWIDTEILFICFFLYYVNWSIACFCISHISHIFYKVK